MMTVSDLLQQQHWTAYALVLGLTYLHCLVSYSLFWIEIPASHHQQQRFRAAAGAAVDHYRKRPNEQVSYRIVALFCSLLTLGTIGRVWVQRGSAASLFLLVIAFLTAYNNGSNVVEPAKKLMTIIDMKKNDDTTPATKKQLLNENDEVRAILESVKRGHVLDFVGFTLMWLVVVVRL